MTVRDPTIRDPRDLIDSLVGVPYKKDGRTPEEGFDCVRSDTLISTPDGPIRVDRISAGRKVFAWLDGKMVARPVIATADKGVKRCVKVRTRNRSLYCTPTHAIPKLVKTRNRNQRGQLRTNEWRVEWTRADQLNRRDLIIVQTSSPDTRAATCTAEEAWFLGLYLGDGRLASNKIVEICVFDDDLAERVRRFAKQAFNANCTRHQSHGVTIFSSAMFRWVADCGIGTGSHAKAVPNMILRSSHDVQRSFCEGFLDSDGYRYTDKNWTRYCSCNRDMIAQVRAMLINLGSAVSNISMQKRNRPITIKGKLVKRATPLYYFEVYPSSHVGNKVALTVSNAKSVFADNFFTCERILSISEESPAKMWDIEVEEAGCFIADGVLVHNCYGLARWALLLRGAEFPDVPTKLFSILAHRRKGVLLDWPCELQPWDVLMITESADLPLVTHVALVVDRANILHTGKEHGGVVLQRWLPYNSRIRSVARLKLP